MKRIMRLPSALPLIGMLLLVLGSPTAMARGVREGLTLCGTALIPSLFPFFVLCTFLVRSGWNAAIGRIAGAPVMRLFRLPSQAAGAICLGLCGGYPVGMRMIAQLHGQGALTQAQAERMSLFCVAAGPAFVMGTVGQAMLGSRATGRLLFAALTLSNLTVGCLLRFTATDPCVRITQPIPFGRAARSLCEAVADAGESMLSVCAWVLLFSGVRTVCTLLPDSVAVPLMCVLEVTAGCRTAMDASLSLPVVAAILGFGGLAVLCQVLPYVTACRIRVSRFFAFRLVGGALSAFYCELLLHLFPRVQAVVLLPENAVVQPVSASAPASAALLLAAAVFIWHTAEPQPKKYLKNIKNVKNLT